MPALSRALPGCYRSTVARDLVISRGVIAGNVTDKYGSRNPVVRRLMAGFDRGLFELLGRVQGITSIYEAGCGEGHVTARLKQRFPDARVVGSDLSPEIVEIARREHPDLEFEQRSIYDIGESGRRWDVVVACEVLEHLEEPERALEGMVGVANLAIVVTVPREPIWRLLNVARGEHLRHLGNTPGHLNHWSTRAFLAMLDRHVDVLDWRTPLPWTQALCRPRSTKAA